jgi:hypothetical protein
MAKDAFEQPVSDAMKALLNELARRIDGLLPRGWGFTLFLFQFSPNDTLLYISNAQREDMIKVAKEFIERQEKLLKTEVQ